ncbi:MAG: peptide deformylase [Dehalococcoidales bacterium]|jgi:peptide deformylase|nr:peptide deformylase [Dehalococcoidales bacterium]
MAIIPIRTVPDPVLRQKARKVPGIDSSIRRLIDDMIETMHEANGVGLAAPQVGVLLRVVVIRLPEEGAEDIVLINPEIVRKSGERIVEERCLSIPGYAGMVKRACNVTVKARDENWKEFRIKGDELLAQALEHEIDHLSGILYIDRLESPEKLVKIESVEAEA